MPQKPNTKGWVYFVTDGEHIKVGFSTKPRGRINALRGAKPLTTLALVEGTVAQEHAVHKAFAGIRTRGEWFKKDDELLALADLARRVGLADAGFPHVEAEENEPDEYVQNAIRLLAVIMRNGAADATDMATRISLVAQRFAVPRSFVWALIYRPTRNIMMKDYLRIISAAALSIEYSLLQAQADSEVVKEIRAPLDRIAEMPSGDEIDQARAAIRPYLPASYSEAQAKQDLGFVD